MLIAPMHGTTGRIRLKIAFFVPIILGQGGVENILINLIQGLQSEGADCRLYVVGGTRHKGWLERVPWSKEITSKSGFRPFRLLDSLFQASRELRAWRPDMIVASDTTMVRLGRWGTKLAGLRNVPVVCWLHCSYRYLKMQDEVIKADANFCICKERADEVQELLERNDQGMAKKNAVYRVYSGTAAGRKPPIRRAQVATFVFAGRIQYEATKRVRDLIDAAGQLRGNFKIKLLGDGPEQEKALIESRAEELGVAEKIEWLGWHLDSWSAVDEASVMVLPSNSEGFSMVTIEALALGLPVVLADFGGVSKEAVVTGKTGWIFPVGDAQALARILQPIVDDPSGLPDADSIRAFAHRFSTEQMIVDFREAAKKVLEAKRAAG